ncbi:MAG: hypothetical protein ACN6QU_15400 [Paraburkholderia terricola]|nr:hypothetical protein B2G74_09210 [Burkholderia sp. A27]
MLRFIFLCAALLFAGTPGYAAIQFKDGWDSQENSNVAQYTKSEATEYLRNKSTALQKIIDGPQACVLEVTKGCHQPGDAHFTVNGAKSTSRCKVDSIYVGSRSDHVACP